MLKLYNDLTKKLTLFRPQQKKRVTMYVCGPTVYDYGHLGHGRSAVAFDIIRRYLLFREYTVEYVFNYTDIDDKLIKRAWENNTTVAQLADEFTRIYDEDYQKLHLLPPTYRPRATEYISQMIGHIRKLEKKGYTYIIPHDGVYYHVQKFAQYGKLSGQKLERLKAGARVDVVKEKHHPEDFVLWKFKKQLEPSWQSPWGEGRPGWHIECSTMAHELLGETIDIHGGGQDLVFPHHEDEIAQSEAVTRKPFARFWLHNGFVLINAEKMAKSLGNFFTLRDAFAKYDPLVIRYFLGSVHYRAPLNFTPEALDGAKQSLERLQRFYDELIVWKEKFPALKKKITIKKYRQAFIAVMDEDMNVSKGLAVVFDFMNDVHRLKQEEKLGRTDALAALNFFMEVDSIFAFLQKEKKKIPVNVTELVAEREKARIAKDWKKADQLREEIKKWGYVVKDTKDGPVLEKSGE